MSNLVTIFGGSGFVGRYVARGMAKKGWRVRVAVRRPNEAMFVKPYGAVGQVEPIFANIRDDDSVRAALHGSDVVINCVGSFDMRGANNVDAVQAEGAERIARIAAEVGISRMVHISAIGADVESDSDYARSKAEGEVGVLRHQPNAVILRPSVVFGPEDEFFNRFAKMARMSPAIPLVGAEAKFQPVYVDDVAQAAVQGALGEAAPGIYELGGPDIRTFRELVQEMLGVIQRRRLVIGLPFWLGSLMGRVFGIVSAMTGGLIAAPITSDQVKNLRRDTVVAESAKTLADLGIEATATEAVLAEYLWPYRPSGQYAAIKNSAKNLKT